MQYDNIIIRNAKMEDIESIARIKVDGWKTTYAGIIDNEILDSMSVDTEINSYTNKYSLDNIFVVESNNQVLAFCRVYDYDESPYDDMEIDCEIREIYVRPDIKRMGIGSKLFNYVLNYFKNKGKNKLYLGVFKDNFNSRKFYEKMGGTLGKEDYLEIRGKSYPVVSYIYNLK